MKSSEKYIRDGRAPIPKNKITSKVMRSNKAKNTKPELKFRMALTRNGIHGFTLHSKSLPGRPDISFNKNKIAVFINGCFWHRCPYCDLAIPKSNRSFWKNKFIKNIKRDKVKKSELQKLGWKVLTIWECKIKNGTRTQINRINNYLN